MGPDDVDVIRTYTRNTGALTGDVAFPTGKDFEIVVDAEAGTDAHGGGGQFEVGVVLRDLTASTTLATPVNHLPTPPSGTNDNFGNPSWPAAGPQRFVYTIPQATINGREDHILQVLAWVRYRVSNPDVSFAESPMFIITRP